MHRARKESIFAKPSKILGVITGDKIITAVDDTTLYPTDGIYLMNAKPEHISNEALSAILNSKFITYLYRLLSSESNRPMAQVKPVILSKLPIPKVNTSTKTNLTQYHNDRHKQTLAINNIQTSLLLLLKSKYDQKKFSKKLQNWINLDVKIFFTELQKTKIKLSLPEEAEWIQYFNDEKEKAMAIVSEINEIDTKINKIIYGLYGLTKEETEAVENSFQ